MTTSINCLSLELYRAIECHIPREHHLVSSLSSKDFLSSLHDERQAVLNTLANSISSKISDASWIEIKKLSENETAGSVVKRALDFMESRQVRLTENARGDAVRVAAERGDSELATVLLENGKVPSMDSDLAMELAAKNGDLELMRTLLESTEISEIYLITLKIVAAEAGHNEIVELINRR